MEKDYDILFVPITTKMSNLEKQFYDELVRQINKYPQITREWLQTRIGLEFTKTGATELLESLEEELRNVHIDKDKIHTLLQINYNIGKSYALKSINKDFRKSFLSDKRSFKFLLKGVDKVIDKFEKIIRNDIKELMGKVWELTPTEIYSQLKDFIKKNHTTPLSSKHRSEMIARTEMQRSFNNGVLQTYSNYGIPLFNIVNYNDIGVCETCIDLIKNNPYTLEEITALLPVHPYCRCLGVIFNTNISFDELELVDNPKIVNMFD